MWPIIKGEQGSEMISPEIVINLLLTYERVHCEVEPNQLSGKRNPAVHTDGNPVTFVKDYRYKL